VNSPETGWITVSTLSAVGLSVSEGVLMKRCGYSAGLIGLGLWLVPLFLIGGLVPPGVAAAQTGNVLLDFQFPPELSQQNLPANVDPAQQQQILYQGDYVTTQSTTLGSREAWEGATGVEGGAVATRSVGLELGFDATFTSGLSLYTVPVAYRLRSGIKLLAAVPLVRRVGKEGEVEDLGDITTSVSWRWGSPLSLLGVTTAIVKAPTGEPNSRDEGEFLPTGTGSWDYAIYQTFVRRLGRWRVDLTAGYRLNTRADFDADVVDGGGSERIELRNGNAANLIIGVDREVPQVAGLVAGLKADVRTIASTTLTVDDAAQSTPGAFTAIDLVPTLQWFVGPGTPLRLGLRIPVNHRDNRDIAFDLGLTRAF